MDSVVYAVAAVIIAALAVWRVEAFGQRVLAVIDTKVNADVAAKKAGTMTPPMPQDLWVFANRESEPWAREQTQAALRDAYDEHGDWDAVRTQVLQ